MSERVRRLLEDLLMALRDANAPALDGLMGEAAQLLEEEG